MNAPLRHTHRGVRYALLALAATACTASAQNAPLAADPTPVALLLYEDRRSDVCFADTFLALVSAESKGAVEPRLTPLDILSPALAAAPIAVLTGEGFFDLRADQRAALRAWLEQGGFLIASAGCSNRDWAMSFRHEIGEMFADTPEARLEPLPWTHPVFDTLYHIERLKRTAPVLAPDADNPDAPPPGPVDASPLESLSFRGRLCIVFSPDGLNDTATFGGACCCCGTGEVIHARQMLANIVAFALAPQAPGNAPAPAPAPGSTPRPATNDPPPQGTIEP